MRRRELRTVLLLSIILAFGNGCETQSESEMPTVPQGFANFSPNTPKSDLITDKFMVEKGELTFDSWVSDTTQPTEPMHGRQFTLTNKSTSITVSATADGWGYLALHKWQDDGTWGDALLSRWLDKVDSTFQASFSYTSEETGVYLVVIGSPWSNNLAYKLKLGCDSDSCSAGSCTYNGQTVEVGQSVPSEDGCNTCTCEKVGEHVGISCTERDCLSGCESEYADNSKAFLSKDPLECAAMMFSCPLGTSMFSGECGCGCVKDTVETCNALTPDPGKVYFSNDLDKCASVNYSCPPNTQYFGDACGCGCLQDASCPDSLGCEPPTLPGSKCADLDTFRERCPLTLIGL